MHAGTLGLLENPAGERLESWAQYDGEPPALDVRQTQETLEDIQGPVQTGAAAARVAATTQEVTVTGTDVERTSVDTVEIAYSEWIAEVTISGIVLAASVATDDERSPFPFDLFTAKTGERCNRYAIDVNRLSDEWAADDVLTDVWMVASEEQTVDGDGVSIDYGENAKLENVGEASIGLGFDRTFAGSDTRGVVFEGGYCAAYRDWPAPKFVRFVEHELVPFAYEYEPPDDDQSFLDEVTG